MLCYTARVLPYEKTDSDQDQHIQSRYIYSCTIFTGQLPLFSHAAKFVRSLNDVSFDCKCASLAVVCFICWQTLSSVERVCTVGAASALPTTSVRLNPPPACRMPAQPYNTAGEINNAIQYIWFLCCLPRADSGVVRIDALHFLTGCRTRWLNQALSVLSLSLGCVVLLTMASFLLFCFVFLCYLCVLSLGCSC